MKLDLKMESIDAIISGSGSYNCTGSSTKQVLDVSGSGDVFGFDLDTKETNISISGSGNVETRASEKLEVKITGSGSVYYKGDARVNTDIRGSGNVVDSN